MSAAAPDKAASADRRVSVEVPDEHAAFLRSMSHVDWLALLVVALYLMVDSTPMTHPVVTFLAMGLFAVFAVGLRWRRLPIWSSRARIALGVAATILFISVMAAQSGGPSSPLVNLYLLPVVLAAVALGGHGTLVVFLAVATAWVALMAQQGDLENPAPVVVARILGQLGPFALVAYLTQRLAGSIIVARQRIAELAEHDGLTGLVNQRSFSELLQRESGSRSRAGSRPCYAVLMVDMDRLKHINDTWGHEAGNAAICNVAEAIRRAIRKSDVAARYGGDEFAIFLPDATPEVAEVVAQRIRNIVFKSLFPAGGRLQRITVSVGVGSCPQDGDHAEEVLAQADRRMYLEKSLRRKSDDPEPPRPGRL